NRRLCAKHSSVPAKGSRSISSYFRAGTRVTKTCASPTRSPSPLAAVSSSPPGVTSIAMWFGITSPGANRSSRSDAAHRLTQASVVLAHLFLLQVIQFDLPVQRGAFDIENGRRLALVPLRVAQRL